MKIFRNTSMMVVFFALGIAQANVLEGRHKRNHSARKVPETQNQIQIRGIRLEGGASRTEGELEVKVGDKWGAVCDTDWHHRDALVSCRTLGFTGGIAKPASDLNQAVSRVHIINVSCSGREETLGHCVLVGQTGECHFADKAAVLCHNQNVSTRLRIPSSLLSRGKSKNMPQRNVYNIPSKTHSGSMYVFFQRRKTTPSKEAHEVQPQTATPTRSPFLVEMPQTRRPTTLSITQEQRFQDFLVYDSSSSNKIASTKINVLASLASVGKLSKEPSNGFLPNRNKRHTRTTTIDKILSEQTMPLSHNQQLRQARELTNSTHNPNSKATTTSMDHSNSPSIFLIVGLVMVALFFAAGCIVGAWQYQQWLGKRDSALPAVSMTKRPSRSILRKESAYAGELLNITVDETSRKSSQVSSTSSASGASTSTASSATEPSTDRVCVEARL